MSIPKTPVEFDYDLWTTEEGKCMVRIKATGEITEVERSVMQVLRSEEKRLRRTISYTHNPHGDCSIDDENRCRKRLKSTEIKGFRGLPSKPEAARNPFQTFSSSNLHTEKVELRDYGFDNCVTRLKVRYKRG